MIERRRRDSPLSLVIEDLIRVLVQATLEHQVAVASRPELPAAVDGVIAKALAKEPDERHASCGELIDFDRLDALPHARYCIQCKQREEDAKKQG